MQAMADGGEAGMVEKRDERRQRPDRERVWRGEAFFHAAHGEVGGEFAGLGRAGQAAGFDHAGAVQHPSGIDEMGSGDFDALQQPVGAIKAENTDLLRLQPSLAQHDAAGMEDGDAAGVQLMIGLAQPELPAIECHGAAAAAQILHVQRFRPRPHHRRDRADDGGGDEAEQHGGEHRRQQKLPGRDPGGARHDQLGGAGEPPERPDTAEQHAEGQDLHGNPGQAQRLDGHHHAEPGVRLAGGAAQQLDEIEHRHQP